MKKKPALLAILIVLSTHFLSAQTVLSQWNFNGTSSTTVPGGPIAPTLSAPIDGAGVIQLIGGVTASFSSGVGSSDLAASPPNFGWQTTGYPASGNEKTAGIIIAIGTAGYNSISLVFDQRLSSTSANTWIVYYTADITATTPDWVQQMTLTFVPNSTSGDSWYNQRTVDFSSITALNDNPNVAFKIVSAFDLSGTTPGAYLASQSGKTYGGGTSRFDMVTVSGIADVVVQTPPVVSASSFSGNLNVGDTLRASYTYSDGEGDAEGTSLYQWFRADDASGTNEIAIPGADTLIYIPVSDDLNKYISFQVTPVALTGDSPGLAVKTSYQGPMQQSLETLLYPAPYDLSSGNYSLQNWASASNPGTYPVNMVFQVFNLEPASKNTKPSALWQCRYDISSKSRMLGLGDQGIGFINTSDAQDNSTCGNGANSGGYVGAAVLAINTTGLANLTLGWTVALKIQGNGTPREYRLMPQYKIAGAATWTDFGVDYEFSSLNAVIDKDSVFTVTLPGVLENLPNVVIRWIYYQVGNTASGSRPEIRLDEITVTVPGAPNSPPSAASLTVVGLPFIGQTLTGSYQYTDAEGDPEGQSSFQWYRADDVSGTNAVVIASANVKTYVLTTADLGKYIAFEVTPVALSGTLQGLAVKSIYNGPVLDLGDPSVIRINEVYTRGDPTNTNADLKTDWVEFYNPGAKDVTLAGLQLCDSDHCMNFSSGANVPLTIPAGGFLALSENDVNSFDFGLSSLGEYIVLIRPDNQVRIDSINFPALDVTQSYGRFLDGTTRLTKLIPPTKGLTNNASTPVDESVTGLLEKETAAKLYPVPVRSELFIIGRGGNEIRSISVMNMTGQLVAETGTSGDTPVVSFAGMKSGLYLVRILYQNGSQETRKIIKE